MKKNPVRRLIVSFFNVIVTFAFLGVAIYIGLFTQIPTKIGNVIRKEIEELKDPYETYNEDFKVNDMSISNNMYYYNTLTKEQKFIYEAIANGVKNFDDEFVVRYYAAGEQDEFADEVSVAIEAFTNDHPEVFYLKAQYSSYIHYAFDSNIGYIRLNYTEDTTTAIKEKIGLMKGRVDYYARGLDGYSDYEKELIIHDRIASDVSYSHLEDLPRKYHTAEGTLLEGVGVCDSFSKAYQLVLNHVGIDSIIVLGELSDGPHAWNMVKIGDSWYHVDITSSHSIYDDTNIINHAYFNLTTEAEKNISKINDESILPKADSTEYNFYYKEGLVLGENEDIYTRISEIDNYFEGRDFMEFYVVGDVSAKISRILNVLRDIDETYLDGTKLYYYNLKNAVIIPKN